MCVDTDCQLRSTHCPPGPPAKATFLFPFPIWSRWVMRWENHPVPALWSHELSQLHAGPEDRCGRGLRPSSGQTKVQTAGGSDPRLSSGSKEARAKGVPVDLAPSHSSTVSALAKTLDLPCPLTTVLYSPEWSYKLAPPCSEGPSLHGFPRRVRGGCSFLEDLPRSAPTTQPPLPPSERGSLVSSNPFPSFGPQNKRTPQGAS